MHATQVDDHARRFNAAARNQRVFRRVSQSAQRSSTYLGSGGRSGGNRVNMCTLVFEGATGAAIYEKMMTTTCSAGQYLDMSYPKCVPCTYAATYAATAPCVHTVARSQSYRDF